MLPALIPKHEDAVIGERLVAGNGLLRVKRLRRIQPNNFRREPTVGKRT